jgi:uncharacterized protein
VSLEIGAAESLGEVAPEEWDLLAGSNNPFVEHAFLRLLETSGSVGGRSGWRPRHVLVRDRGELVAAAPAYEKSDSWGEYIFDWGWAQAAQRAGVRYYPKLVVGVPFTPATGPRLLLRPDRDRAELVDAIVRGLDRIEKDSRASSAHVLFCRSEEAEALEARGFMRRATHQFHWRNDSYPDFDAFLAALRSEPRKQIRRERRRLAESGLQIELKEGLEISSEDWRALDRFYRSTAREKGSTPYLSPKFFAGARDTIGHRALAIIARRGSDPIAASLSFQKGEHVYGRHWGALEFVEGLHFELCYYRLIDHAIRTKKTLVEAGAQGEHKVKRGFLPVAIHSAHRFGHPVLSQAIERFVRSERADLLTGLERFPEDSPFRVDAMPKKPLLAGLEEP